ncbi:hypothetical protein ONZ51_g927 [Trametes cubensis]|uniref:Uncharacterized protein n=1 Tax=Trametes cubensis TaxID=1111947 RepID=A0AAD7XFA9_9APHY|nr:hypothetical protein ONZ51_g927 [Trametes cubensis]
MTAFLAQSILTPFFRRIVIPMAVFVWGFAWLMLSVLIFLAGRLVPQIHSKPPVVVLKPRSPRSPRSPRIRSAPASPTLPPQECDPVPADEAASCKTSVSAPEPSLPSHPSTPSNGRSRPGARKKWSLPTYFFPNRSVPSPKSSLFSEGSATLVGSPSPPRFFPELPMIESATVSEDPSCDQDPARSSRSTPASSPRTGRGMRLPNVKVFKVLSRKLSKQKADPASSRESSPRPSVDLSQENPAVCEEKSETLMRRRTMDAGSSRPARPGHLLHERNLSLPGEVFTTTFVNPFRVRLLALTLNANSVLIQTMIQSSTLRIPTRPLRGARLPPRRMLTSFQLALTSPIQKSHARSNSNSQSQSRRSSISSTSTAVSTFSAPSVLSSTGSPTSPRRHFSFVSESHPAVRRALFRASAKAGGGVGALEFEFKSEHTPETGSKAGVVVAPKEARDRRGGECGRGWRGGEAECAGAEVGSAPDRTALCASVGFGDGDGGGAGAVRPRPSAWEQ